MTAGVGLPAVEYDWNGQIKRVDVANGNGIACGYNPNRTMAYKTTYDAGTNSSSRTWFVFDTTGEIALNIAGAVVDAMDTYATGLTIAVVGAEFDSDFPIGMGSFIMQMAPLALARGMASPVSSLAKGICFTEGTEILTVSGEVAIGNIRVGDWVWATDPVLNVL